MLTRQLAPCSLEHSSRAHLCHSPAAATPAACSTPSAITPSCSSQLADLPWFRKRRGLKARAVSEWRPASSASYIATVGAFGHLRGDTALVRFSDIPHLLQFRRTQIRQSKGHFYCLGVTFEHVCMYNISAHNVNNEDIPG